MQWACKWIVAVSVVLFANPAWSYRNFTCNGVPLKWGASTVMFNVPTPVSADFQTALNEIFSQYNAIGANLRIQWQPNSSLTRISPIPQAGVLNWWNFVGPSTPGNGVNEIWWANLTSGPARTALHMDCAAGRLLEADIILSSHPIFPVTYSKHKGASRAYSNVNFNVLRVHNMLMHELGHAVGFAHEDRYYNLMGDSETHIHVNGTTANPYFGQDLSWGIRSVYGWNSQVINEDFGVTHWKRWSSDPDLGYSKHTRTDSSAWDGSDEDDAEPIYVMERGKTYTVTLTFENNGKGGDTKNIRFYLSKDNNISAVTDTVIITNPFPYVLTIPSDAQLLQTYSVKIPNNAPLGTQWLGVGIEVVNSFDPSVNNFTYFSKIDVK